MGQLKFIQCKQEILKIAILNFQQQPIAKDIKISQEIYEKVKIQKFAAKIFHSNFWH